MTESNRVLSRTEVVSAIRERILRGDLAPGQRLVEAELCEVLRTSRGTARAALMDLAHEGLVERIANRGARVRVVTLDEALQIVEVRLAIESLCVARAAERISDKEIKQFREYAKQLKQCAATSDAEGFAELTRKIFEHYLRIANHHVAADMLHRLRAQSTRHRFRLTFRPGRAEVAVPYWLDLIEAICNRDPAKAQQALRRHGRNIEQSMRALASEDTAYPIISGALDG